MSEYICSDTSWRLKIYAFAFTIWCFGVWFVPYSAYWRDGSEFIVTAFSLDVAHPAGFPIYSQLANFFALLPLGPIAWRVNLFNIFCGLVCALLCAAISYRLIKRLIPASSTSCRAVSVGVATLLLFLSPAFFRQWLTTEVYLLNTIFIQLLLFLYLLWDEKRDDRLVLCCAFVSGLAAGNHVAVLVTLLFMAPLLFSEGRFIRLIPSASIFFALGLSVYGYIPARAVTNPPFNTGEASSLERLVDLVSDRRDRELRELSLFGLAAADPVTMLAGDIQTITGEVGLAGLLAGLAGVILVIIKSWRSGAALLAVALSNWIFFFGWTPDPWLPLLVMLMVGFSFACAHLLSSASNRATTLLIYSVILFALPILSFVTKSKNLNYAAYRDYDLPVRSARQFVSDIKHDEIALIEPHWFLAKYLATVEGYRDDVRFVYLPELLFPEHFRPLRMSRMDGAKFDAAKPGEFSKLGEYSGPSLQMVAFLEYTSSEQRMLVEPVVSINRFLSSVFIFEESGATSIEWGKNGGYAGSAADSFLARLMRIKEQAIPDGGGLREDAISYLETLLAGYMSMLNEKGEVQSTRDLGAAFCGPDNTLFCSSRLLNNISAYSIALKDFEGAARWALLGLRDGSKDAKALQQNLQIALQYLSPEQKLAIMSQFSGIASAQ